MKRSLVRGTPPYCSVLVLSGCVIYAGLIPHAHALNFGTQSPAPQSRSSCRTLNSPEYVTKLCRNIPKRPRSSNHQLWRLSIGRTVSKRGRRGRAWAGTYGMCRQPEIAPYRSRLHLRGVTGCAVGKWSFPQEALEGCLAHAHIYPVRPLFRARSSPGIGWNEPTSRNSVMTICT